jgi:hypothetical protein
VDQFGDDLELKEGNGEPDVDNEPFLGSGSGHHGIGASYVWGGVHGSWGPEDDLEPGLGWTTGQPRQRRPVGTQGQAPSAAP